MRSEQEIRQALAACSKVANYGISDGPCPLDPRGKEGCCAECTAPSTLLWVLGSVDRANVNGQERMFARFNEIVGGDEKKEDTT